MWKSIHISQQTYFVYCNFDDIKEEVTLVLYDLKEAWCQTVALKDVKLKVKVLNKRYDFNENNIKEALTSGELKFGAIEEQPHSSTIEQESLLLKIKYGIKNCVLNYEWNLRRQSQQEFQKDFVQPLLAALLGCYQQVEILTECIRKKDAELQQYRIEGAVLSRKTLATKPFDFDSFKTKYDDFNKIAINFKELAKYVIETTSSTSFQTLNDGTILQPTRNKEKSNNLQNNANREELTPKRKKRRKEIEFLCLERHLKIRKEGLKYESSQSESVTSENSQMHEELKNEIIKEKQQTLDTDCNVNINNDDDGSKSPRKSARYSPIKPKREYELDRDTCDSDNTNKLPTSKPNDNSNLRSLREGKSSDSSKTSAKTLDVFQFLADGEDNKPLAQLRKSLRESQSKSHAALSSSPSKSNNLSHSPLPPVIDDLSSQLNNIKKELESLEAMRLADLRKRSFKA